MCSYHVRVKPPVAIRPRGWNSWERIGKRCHVVVEIRRRAIGPVAVADAWLFDADELHRCSEHYCAQHLRPAVTARAEWLLDRVAGQPRNEDDHRQPTVCSGRARRVGPYPIALGARYFTVGDVESGRRFIRHRRSPRSFGQRSTAATYGELDRVARAQASEECTELDRIGEGLAVGRDNLVAQSKAGLLERRTRPEAHDRRSLASVRRSDARAEIGATAQRLVCFRDNALVAPESQRQRDNEPNEHAERHRESPKFNRR